MKQCPKCGSTYTDSTLSFCLTDGAPLDDAPERTERFTVDGEPTVGTGGETDGRRIRFDISAEKEEDTVTAGRAPAGGETRRSGIGVGTVVAIVGTLVVVIAVLSAVLLYVVTRESDTSSETAQNSNSSSGDVDELKKKVEELGGRIENSEKRDEDTPTPSPSPAEEDPGFDDEVIQRVNSPSDGFLALRDQPSARIGKRIAKIPHGDIVVLGKCNEDTETIQGRTGRWCRVRWEGKEGWVFDVWLTD